MFETIKKLVKSFMRKLKSTNGNSLAEFAVTTAMMATLATTAAPKFGAVGAGAEIRCAKVHKVDRRTPGLEINIPSDSIDMFRSKSD